MIPLIALRDELERGWTVGLDLDRARSRVAAGQVALDPLEAIGAAGDLMLAYTRATVALERAGLANDDEAAQARERRSQIMALLASWLTGEPVSRDRVRATARRAAALVGSSVLRRARWDALGRHAALVWPRPHCPCCSGTPDFALSVDDARYLVCSRCDAQWMTPIRGCLGCDATDAPSIARVSTPVIGYSLAICNPCGRYLKEPTGAFLADPLIERALTAELDAAAEARGLRL